MRKVRSDAENCWGLRNYSDTTSEIIHLVFGQGQTHFFHPVWGLIFLLDSRADEILFFVPVDAFFILLVRIAENGSVDAKLSHFSLNSSRSK